MPNSKTSPLRILLIFSLVLSSQSFSSNIGPVSFSRPNRHQCWLSRTNQEASGASSPPPRQTKGAKRPNNNYNNNNNNHNSNRRPKGPKGGGQNQNRQHQSTSPKRRSTYSPGKNRKLNQEIVKQANAQDLLGLLGSSKGALTTVGGGGVMNSVNFSTALHRIARHLQYSYQNPDDDGNDRSRILSDPRFALLVCSAAEAILMGNKFGEGPDSSPVIFGSREMSNIAWALAKLKIAPPSNALAVDVTANSEKLLKAKSEQLRATVYQVAKERAASGQTSTTWIPVLSELAGLIMDTISFRVKNVDPGLFRLQEWANLLWALATAQRSNEQVFTFIISSLMAGMEDVDKTDSEGLRPQEWSNSVWALATSGIAGPEEKLLPFVADLMGSNQEFLDTFKPQELSNTVWGVATILSKRPGIPEGPECEAALQICRHVARQLVHRRGQGYKSQELTNTAWAFATLGFGITGNVGLDNSLTDYTVLVTDELEGDRKLMQGALQVVLEIAKRGLIRKFRSQELNNLAWTMARLDMGDGELLKQIGMELRNPRRQVTSQDIGTTLWSFATLNYLEPDLYRGITARLTKDRARFAKPQELSNTLWALATADVIPRYIDTFDSTVLAQGMRPSPAEAESDPITMCFALASQELMRRPQEFKTQEIKDILWAFSRVGMRHPALFKSVGEHLMGRGDHAEITGRGLADFSPQGLGNLAWAFAKQAQLGGDVMTRYDTKINVPRSSGRLAHYTTSFIDIGEHLLQKLFHAIAETDLKVHGNLSKLKPQDLSNTAWAFAILGMKHTPFLEAVAAQLQDRVQRYMNGKRDIMTRFKSQEVANTLWALATLSYTQQGLLYNVAPYIIELAPVGESEQMTVPTIARVWKRQELANLAWICAVFGEYPPALVELLYMGLVGVGDRADANYVQKSHNDGGIEQSAVMSLTYLQIAMDLDLPPAESGNRLSLPDDFPKSWDSRSSDSVMDDNGAFELLLTSSKIQQTVSKAFNRIGFSHVEEHVIGMDTLAQDFGIQMAVDPKKEVLSLDLANVESKIGIEVDGPGHFISNIDNGSTSRGKVSKINGRLEYQFDWNSEFQEINGPTALKSRILNKLGWRVMNIPFWEWYKMNSDKQKEEDYCESVLNQ